MARRLGGLQEILFKAVRCFSTLHTGERVYYQFRRGEVKDLPTCNGPAPAVYITPEPGGFAKESGWYPVSALYFEMPNGEIVK